MICYTLNFMVFPTTALDRFCRVTIDQTRHRLFRICANRHKNRFYLASWWRHGILFKNHVEWYHDIFLEDDTWHIMLFTWYIMRYLYQDVWFDRSVPLHVYNINACPECTKLKMLNDDAWEHSVQATKFVTLFISSCILPNLTSFDIQGASVGRRFG